MTEEFEYDKYIELLNGLQNLAMAMGEYYRALIKEGFSDQNAVYLVGQWQASILQNAKAVNHDSGQ